MRHSEVALAEMRRRSVRGAMLLTAITLGMAFAAMWASLPA